MTIHTIGDSHSYFGWTNIKNHHLGPILCYTFGKENLKRCNLNNFNISNNDTIVFCLGEIDCRCHIHKFIHEKSYEDIIDDLVNNYLDAINLIIEKSNLKQLKICIYNVVPPVNKHNSNENKAYPFLGTDDERKNYVLYFNKKLKEKCQIHNYIFFDVYEKYCDSYGYLSKKYSDMHVHIKNGIFIDEFIKENNLS